MDSAPRTRVVERILRAHFADFVPSKDYRSRAAREIVEALSDAPDDRPASDQEDAR
jgi:hypothetical protein